MTDLAPIAPSAIHYIKLGKNGAWEAASFDHDRIETCNANDPLDLGKAGDWEGARAHYLAQGLAPGTATKYANDLKIFFTAGRDTLWITFGRGFLWWAFAEPGVTVRGAETATHAAAYLRTAGQWRNTDITGRPLVIEAISSALTRITSYQQTMCSVGASDYLLRLINAQPDPALMEALDARGTLQRALLPVIQHLHQDDFELFVELLTARLGWQRLSQLGGTMKDIDMLLQLPATGLTTAVQVKSSATNAVVRKCAQSFAEGSPADEMIFATHTARGALSVPDGPRPFHIWTGDDLARKAVAAGMTDWLLARG